MLINVRVQPKSSQRALEQLDDGVYKAYVHAAPEDNKANEELITLVASEFGLKRYRVEIVGGLTSRYKKVRIDIDS